MGNKKTYRNSKLSAVFDYLEGKITGKERYAVERNLERDPFEAEAMEGFEHVSREEAEDDLRLLSEKLKEKRVPAGRPKWYAIAAAVASIMVVSTLFLLLNDGGIKKYESFPELREAANEKEMPAPGSDEVKKEQEIPDAQPGTTAESESNFGGTAGGAIQSDVPEKNNHKTGEPQAAVSREAEPAKSVRKIKNAGGTADQEEVKLEITDEKLADKGSLDKTKGSEIIADEVKMDERMMDKAKVEEEMMNEAKVNEARIEEAKMDEEMMNEAKVNEEMMNEAKVNEEMMDKAMMDDVMMNEVNMDEAKKVLAYGSLSDKETIEISSIDQDNDLKINQEPINTAIDEQAQGEIVKVQTESETSPAVAMTSPGRLSAKPSGKGTGDKINKKMWKNVVYHNSSETDISRPKIVDSKKQRTSDHRSKITFPSFNATRIIALPVGGYEAFLTYLDSSLVLPDSIIISDSLTVELKFNISPDGTPSDFQILHSPEKILSEKAIEVIKKGPPWTPATENGEYVKCEYILEAKFSPEK